MERNADAGGRPIRIDLIQHARIDAALIEDVRRAARDRIDPVAPETADIDLRHGERTEQGARLFGREIGHLGALL